MNILYSTLILAAAIAMALIAGAYEGMKEGRRRERAEREQQDDSDQPGRGINPRPIFCYHARELDGSRSTDCGVRIHPRPRSRSVCPCCGRMLRRWKALAELRSGR